MAEGAAIVCDDLAVRYGAAEAVSGVSFQVGHGEVFGLLGPNGAGKTSLLRVLTTLVRPHRGRVLVLGHDVSRSAGTVRRLIGFVPQVLSADGWLTGRQNLRLFADLHHVPWSARRRRVQDLLDLVGLGAVADDLVTTYSGGMVRRLELAGALLAAPRVLLLDEPTLGLDPIARRDLWGHLHALRGEREMTVLTTTHYLEEAEEHCDRVALMGAGRLLAVGTPEELRVAAGHAEGTLEDVFVAVQAGHREERGGFRDIDRVRRTARRLL